MVPGFDLSRAPFYPTWHFNGRRRSSTPAVRWIVLLSFRCHVYFILHTRVQFARGGEGEPTSNASQSSVSQPRSWRRWLGVGKSFSAVGKKATWNARGKTYFSPRVAVVCVCCSDSEMSKVEFQINTMLSLGGWEPGSSSHGKVNLCTPVRLGWLWGDIRLKLLINTIISSNMSCKDLHKDINKYYDHPSNYSQQFILQPNVKKTFSASKQHEYECR